MSSVYPISRLRFDAVAGYVRNLSSYVLSEEIAWYEHANRPVIGTLLRDRVDDDFGGIVMGRDGRGRFRCVDVSAFSDSPEIASKLLVASMGSWSKRPESDFIQGDEMGEAPNIFAPVVSAHKLSPAYIKLATSEGFSPARALIEAMMHYYEDVDGNFIEQFQSTAFDARFWELYLFALLSEERFVFDRSYSAPDFVCEGLLQDIFVEGVTVGPTRIGSVVTEPLPPDDPAGIHAYLSEYMPIKWAGVLTSKLQKEYWKLRHVKDKPIVFAVQDFHAPRSMTFTGSTLLPYLYGMRFSALYDQFENLRVNSSRIYEHRWGDKRVESGFFYLPDVEMISAVIHNPTATLSKFNRMARLAKMGSQAVRMVRFGTVYDPDPDAALPLAYHQNVDDPSYVETWCEGLNVFHNPNARHPLDPRLFRAAMHHRLRGDRMVHTVPPFHPYSANTLILSPKRLKRSTVSEEVRKNRMLAAAGLFAGTLGSLTSRHIRN